MQRELDLVLWGATGFTGQLVANYLLEAYGVDENNLRWGLAGRNEKKLQEFRSQLEKINPNAKNLKIFTSNGDDLDGLKKIARTTKVICSTVGPYNAFGKTLLDACFEEETSYTDLTGEPNFIHYSIQKYHEKARNKKIRFVHSCGFDSIPSDMGTLFLQSKSKEIFGDLCKEVIYIAKDSKGSFSGGTIASLLGVIEEAASNSSVREILNDPYSLNPSGIRGSDSADPLDIIYIDADKSWAAPFLMGPVNTRVVRRSSAILYNSNPFGYQERMGFGDGFAGWAIAQSVRLALGSIILLGSNGITKPLLYSILPSSGEGPDKTLQETGYFTITILGFKESSGPSADIKVEIYGRRDPGYGATSRMLAESSIALALGETQPNYGVVTPATAFGLPLLKRLEKVGIQFRESISGMPVS